MYNVYVILSSSDNRRYIGSTGQLQKRLNDHNSGESRSTKNRGPWTLIHVESFDSRGQAMIRERFLKSGKGRELLAGMYK